MNEYGRYVIITGDVQYVGEGENPKDNIGFQMWERAYNEVHGCDFCEGVCKCMLRQKNPTTENNFTKKSGE